MEDQVLFFRQLALLAANGIDLPAAVNYLSETNESEPVRSFCRRALSESSPESSSLGIIGRISPILASLADISDRKGYVQPDVLYDMADVCETASIYRGAVTGALIYPVKVFFIALLLWVILLVFVVPVFNELFSGFSASLPGPTRFMIDISRWVQQYFHYVLALMLGLGVLLIWVKKAQQLVLWLFGGLRRLIKDYTAIQFCRLFSILLANHIPLPDAIRLAAEEIPETAYSNRLKNVGKDVLHPSELKAFLKQTTIFSTSILALIDLGENQSPLAHLFGQFGLYLRKGFEKRLSGSIKSIEIAALVWVALVVGTMVIAMYLPIFRMASVIG